MELFILRDKFGKEIETAYFPNYESAKAALPEEYQKYELVSEKQVLSERYLPRIKKLNPTLKKSGIVLDVNDAVFIRNGNTGEYYTFIPFTYYGAKRFCYRETASDEWVEAI